MNRFVLISFIGVDDSVLIRQFVEHHRSLGVTDFHLILHGSWPEDRLDYLSEQDDVLICEKIDQPYSERLLRQKYNELIQTLIGHWIVLVDGDEFLEIPYSTLSQVAACMRKLGINDLPAFMIQRLTSEGSLRVPDEHGDINRQFPMMNFSLCEDLNVENPTWKDKFPFFFASSSCESRRGNHLPPNGISPSNAPIRAIIHHFKWTARFGETIAKWSPGTGRGNEEEFLAYKKWFEENNYTLPIESNVTYSRQALFEQGLLVKPSSHEFEIASLLARVQRSRLSKDQAPIARRLERLKRLATTPGGMDPELINPRNLLLTPGRICFVTFEITGPTKTGGIGTAIGALAESLVQLGHEVEVVFSPFRGEIKIPELWLDYWSRKGVCVHYLPRAFKDSTRYTPHAEFNEKLDTFLDGLRFDLIHFIDGGGYAGRFCRALKSRSDRPGVRTILTVHGPGEWHRRGNLIPWQDDEPAERVAFQYALELSDAVVFPSRYMLDWAASKFRICARHGVIPNVLSGTGRSFGSSSQELRKIKEIVYFGRVEPRKGFHVFCEALDKLSRVLDSLPKITVMGRLGENMNKNALFDAFGNVRDHVKYIENYGNIDAINYLKTRDCVAVIPSKLDNLPYTVYESVENNIPLMTTGAGGIRELIDERDHERVLVAGDSETLAIALQRAVMEGFAPARPAFDASMANVEQLAIHARLVAEARGEVPSTVNNRTETAPDITGIRYGKPDPDTIGSSQAGSDDTRQRQRGPWNWAAEANGRVSKTDSELIFLLDKDVRVIKPGALESMRNLLRAGDYDAVVSDCLVEFGGEQGPRVSMEDDGQNVIALAGPAELSPMKNIYGAGSLLIKRSCFLELGGFHENLSDSRYGHWELLNRLQAAQCRIAAVPVQLVAWKFEDTAAWNAEFEHELVEYLVRPWLRGLDYNQENIVRYSTGSLIGKRPWAWVKKENASARTVKQPFFRRLTNRLSFRRITEHREAGTKSQDTGADQPGGQTMEANFHLRPFRIKGTRLEKKDSCFVVKTSGGKSDIIRSSFPVDQLWAELNGHLTLSQIHARLSESPDLPGKTGTGWIDDILEHLASMEAVAFSPNTSPQVIDIVDLAALNPGDPRGLRFLYIDEMEPNAKKGFGFPRARRILQIFDELGIETVLCGTRIDAQKSARLEKMNPGMDDVESDYKLQNLVSVLKSQGDDIDAIWISRLRNMKLWLQARHIVNPGVPVIFDSEAAVSLRDLASLEFQGITVSDSEKDQIINDELTAVGEADIVFTVSPAEKRFFHDANIGPVYSLGSPYDPCPTPASFHERSGIFFLNGLFLGTQQHEAVDYLVGEVFPELPASSQIDMWLYGYGSEALKLPEVDQNLAPRIHIGGFVDDLAYIYQKHRLAVIGTRFSSGVPWKAIECMAHGVPLVVTPLVARQLEVGTEHVLIGRDKKEFASEIHRLYEDEKLWLKLRENGLEYVRLNCATENARYLIRQTGKWIEYQKRGHVPY